MSAVADVTTSAPTPLELAASLFEQLESAWNRADGPAYGAPFADETDFVNIRGEHHRGDGAYVGRAHQGIFDTIYAGSTVRYQVDVARQIVPGCLVAVATSTLRAPQGPLQGVHQSRLTIVVTERSGRWEITALQNTLVIPQERPEPG